MMCQICMCHEHCGIVNVVRVAVVLLCAHEGGVTGLNTERRRMVLSSQVCKPAARVGESRNTLMTITHCVGACRVIVHANSSCNSKCSS